jgi:hypothetical protein
MQMMETSGNAPTALTPEPAQPRGRARPPRKATEEAPMQMVETGGSPSSTPPQQ